MKKHFCRNIFLIIIFFSSNFVYAQNEESIKLLDHSLQRGKLLMQALNDRASGRSFSDKELSLELISNLLWAASGVNRQKEAKLTAPSAKNAQEIDIYVATKKGLYIYEPFLNVLKLVLNKDIRAFAGEQDFVKVAPLTLIYVVNYLKLGGKNQDSMFYAATDTGFISQNVYLFSASEGLATVVLGWVNKKKLKEIMSLNDDQDIILTQPVGYKG